MTRFSALMVTACTAAISSSGAAFADVTAAEVWADWKDQFGYYGDDGVSIGSETAASGKVIVSDLAFSMKDSGSSFDASLASVVFEENGDGTVTVTMSDTIPMVIEDEFGGSVKMSVTQSGLDMVVSGDAGAMNYAISSDRYAISVDEIIEDGAKVDADMRFVLNGLSGTYSNTVKDTRDVVSDLAAASMDFIVDGTDTDNGAEFLISGKVDGLAAIVNLSVPTDADFENPENLFENGFSMDGSYSYDGSSMIFDIKDNGDDASGTVQTGGSVLNFGLDKSSMAYDAKASGLVAQITVPDLPFPVELSMAEYGVGFEMPLAQTAEPADFGVSFDLIDLKVSDQIWSMVDPTNAFGRDPATISLGLSGTAKMFFDILDPEQAAAMENSDVPGELHTLNLDRLKLAVAGALLTGEGAFTFDNSDIGSLIPDMPRPEGSVTVNLTGGNKLIDTLVDMGMIPSDQAMGARMMMGMFARTVGDDELTSTLEVNSQGHVLANGQRIQ